MKGLSHIPEIVIWPFTARLVVKHGSAVKRPSLSGTLPGLGRTLTSQSKVTYERSKSYS